MRANSGAIQSYWANPETRTFGELLIDCEEDRALRAVLVGMLRDDELLRSFLATPHQGSGAGCGSSALSRQTVAPSLSVLSRYGGVHPLPYFGTRLPGRECQFIKPLRLGHRSPSFTLDRYAHAIRGRQKELAKEIGAALKSGSRF